jgi:hypothetical protein
MPAAAKLLTISAWASRKRNLPCAQLRAALKTYLAISLWHWPRICA